MITITLAEIAALTGGRLDGEDAPVGSVSTDTRSMQQGALFVALAAARDGHQFLPAAHAAGAAGAIVRGDAAVPAGLPAVRVADPMRALTDLAAAVRARLSARVVAITGSNGKTCTKDFTAAILSAHMPTVASAASFNNEIGVPLTVLSATPETEALIVEVGARGPGHIRSLMPVVRPDVSIVTNVGLAHAGMFGSLDAVAAAKGELVAALGAGGCAVLNADDERVSAMAVPGGAATVTFGLGDADVRATDVVLDERARATFLLHAGGQTARVTLPVPGEHMVPNALAATAASLRFGLDAHQAAAALAGAATSAHRMRLIDGPDGVLILDDAYNASPASMTAALKTLARLGRGRRTVAILGTMAELGDIAATEHDRAGRLAVRLGIGKLVTVGDDAIAMHEAARMEGMSPDDALFAAGIDDALALAARVVEDGDVVLVKASRVAGLERIAEMLAGTTVAGGAR